MAYGGASSVLESDGVGTSTTLAFNAVPANATVVVAVSVRHTSVGSGDLISSISSSPSLSTAFAIPTNGKGHRTPDDAGSGRHGIYFFVGRTGGSQQDYTFTLNFPNSSNLVKAQAIYFTGQASTPFDVADDGTAANAASAVAAGPITPSQSAADLVYFAAGKWWWDFSDPASITKVSESNDNSAGKLPHWLGYRSVNTSPIAYSVSWDVPASQGDGGLALIMALKVGGSGTKKLRIEFVTGSGINGVTGLSIDCWIGDPTSNYAQTITGVSAEASGDRIDAPAPTGAGADGEEWEVHVYKTGYGSDHGIGTIVTV